MNNQEEEKMSYQERRTIMSMLSGIIIFVGYSLYIYQKYNDRLFGNEIDLKFWATAILMMIPVSIVARIVIHIIFSIINEVTSREKDPKITDERDKLIDLRAGRNSHYVFGLGFMLGMLSLLFEGTPTYMMFVCFVLFGFLSEMIEGITRLYYYRRGF